MAKEGPQYAGCPVDCSGPKADPKRGCPKCEYTIQRRFTDREIEAEFKKNSPGPEADRQWPLKLIIENLGVVSRAHTMARKGYNPKWTVRVARLVEIYRDEISKMRASDDWNHSKKLEAKMKALEAQGKASRDDYDE